MIHPGSLSVRGDNQKRDGRAKPCRYTIFLQSRNRLTCYDLDRHLCDFENLIGDRVLQHSSQRVLARSTHDDLTDTQTLRNPVDSSRLFPQLHMFGKRNTMLVQQLA